jgi:tetratricopeptide (TPR) repeat protein
VRAVRGTAVPLILSGFGLLAHSCGSSTTVAQRARPAVVLIKTTDAQGRDLEFGSGFIIDSSGLIVSSLHVLGNAADATITLTDSDRVLRHPTIVGFDKETDLVVLRAPASRLPTLEMSRRDTVAVGERVLAIGNPERYVGTVSDGIVSSIRQDEAGALYQLTAPVSSGSSGGPVLDERGDVVGVIESSVAPDRLPNVPPQNLNFARPIAYVTPLLTQSRNWTFADLSMHLLQSQRSPGQAIAPDEYQHGLDLYRQHNLDAAIKALETAIHNNPSDANAYVQVGAIFANDLHNEDEAVHFLEEGLKLAPDDAVAHGLLAVMYRQERRYEDAVSESRKAITLSPLNAGFHLALGITLAENHDEAGALAEFGEAATLSPTSAAIYYNRALVYERVGNPSAAAGDWSQFLTLARQLPPTQELQAQMAVADKRAGRPEIVQAVIQPDGTTLRLAAGRTYVYGMTTDGSRPSTALSAPSPRQLVHAGNQAGRLAAALAYGPSDHNSYTTQTHAHAIGGVSVTGNWTNMTAIWGSSHPQTPSAAWASFNVSADSLVIVIGLGAGQQRISLEGLPGLSTDATEPGADTQAMIIAHTYLGAGRYKVTETTRSAPGQDPSNEADLIGVFVFTR